MGSGVSGVWSEERFGASSIRMIDPLKTALYQIYMKVNS